MFPIHYGLEKIFIFGDIHLNKLDTVNFEHMKTCFRLFDKTTECAYMRYIQFKILHNRSVTQTLLRKMGKSESWLY